MDIFNIGKSLTNELSELILNGITSWLYETYCKLGVVITTTYTERFGPDVTTFIEYVGVQTQLQNYMNVLACTLAFGIFIFYIALVMLKKIRLADVRETMPTLVGKLILVLIGIANSVIISDALFSVMNSAYKELQMYGYNTSIDFTDAIIKLFVPVSLATLLTDNNILVCILCMIFGIIFIKEFIVLMLEVIERYIVACLLKYSFSLPLATCVTRNTSAIFKKYIQMYLCQILLLIFNTIMINMVLNMVDRIETMQTIVGWMFMFSFMKVCRRIDSYLHTMGMSVAVTGGNVLDDIGHSVRGMMRLAGIGTSIVAPSNTLHTAFRLDQLYELQANGVDSRQKADWSAVR